ncbi:MAG TPA: SDR family oxidoreductase [Gemmataceae bacterium]|nr:SDR family oxidoreductase [Gemmataceae bacterium]
MRVLLTGASGQLGSYVLRELRDQQIATIAWSHTQTGRRFGFPLRPVDITDADALANAFHEAHPTLVIHAGAISQVAQCFLHPQKAHQVNACGSAMLAELAAHAVVRFLQVSTDLVFDGERGSYCEQEPPHPLSIYGQTKVAAEQAVLSWPAHAVARVSLLFGPSISSRPSFFDTLATALRERRPSKLFEDEWRSPLSFLTAARGLIRVASSDLTGLLHMGGPERMTRLEMGRRLAAFLNADPGLLLAAPRNSDPAAEPRPRDTSLDSSRWRALFPNQEWPSWDDALAAMTGDRFE